MNIYEIWIKIFRMFLRVFLQVRYIDYLQGSFCPPLGHSSQHIGCQQDFFYPLPSHFFQHIGCLQDSFCLPPSHSSHLFSFFREFYLVILFRHLDYTNSKTVCLFHFNFCRHFWTILKGLTCYGEGSKLICFNLFNFFPDYFCRWKKVFP